MNRDSLISDAIAIAGGMAVIALLILIDLLGASYEAGGF